MSCSSARRVAGPRTALARGPAERRGGNLMGRTDDRSAWVITGVLGALALGVALIPLRTVVVASNLAFVFLAFTIVVAELGGRTPALVTALVSAMSLNFFLTEPYLTLAITKVDDVVAFFALVGCGLIAAAFGRRRGRLSAAAGRVQIIGGDLTPPPLA